MKLRGHTAKEAGVRWRDAAPAELGELADAIDAAVAENVTKKTTKLGVLEAAITAVDARGLAYDGRPENNFERIARLWNTHLVNAGLLDVSVLQNGTGLQPSDVAVMMILMKTARIESKPDHLDSWVDIAGYAACGGELTA